ncbi:glycosyltransferase [Stenotrophomonas humi]
MRMSQMYTSREPKKICHVIEATATGTLSMASMLTFSQAASGHDVSVVFSRRPETPADIQKHFPPSTSLKHIQMHTLKERITCLLHLRSALTDLAPDVVFLHSSFAGFFGRLALWKAPGKIKIFYLPHCISFMRKDITGIKRMALVALERFAGIRPSTYVACSASERDAIRKYLPACQSVLIENAVPAYPIAQIRRHDQPLTVINVGQIRVQKNPALFASIAQAAHAAGLPLRFMWLGDGDPAARRHMEICRVEVTGWVSRSQVLEALAANSIFLSTSSWEGLPVALIEAQMAAVPVVATPCSGNRDCITHGQTGWLYSTADQAINILRQIVENPSWANTVADNAEKMAATRFGQPRYDQQMEDLLHAHI